jgi:hypothetical protein
MRVIVAKEKDDTHYLDASTDEAWAKSSLALLTERFNDGYWYDDPVESQSEYYIKERTAREELLALTPEELERVPEVVRENLKRRIQEARASQRYEEEMTKEYAEIKRVVETQDLSWVGTGNYRRPLAWHLLDNRSNHEYEHVELVTTKSPA